MTYFGLIDQENQTGQTAIAAETRLLATIHPPVFLHCGWRTRGTWIGNRFRQRPGVTGFYEPLAEHLAALRTEAVASIGAGSWPSGHRGLDRPYFEEFRPLLRPDRTGVLGYRENFATGDFFAAPDTPLPDLYGYLRKLLRTAQDRGEQPVLKFCRSLGRIGWMRRHFPDAVHIAVLRDPFSQFASALRQYVGEDNGYFLAMPLLLLAMNRDLPLVERCTRDLGVTLPALPSARRGREACEASLRAGDPNSWYRGLLAFWLATASAMPGAADLVIDSEALVHAGPYRRHCEAELSRLTGQTIDFGDADPSGATRNRDTPSPRRSDVLGAHAAAEAFLTDRLGPYWADRPGLGIIAELLADARVRALRSGLTRRGPRPTEPFPLDDGSDRGALLASSTVRAVWAERELAAMRSSHSWKVTAPLRWLRQRLG